MDTDRQAHDHARFLQRHHEAAWKWAMRLTDANRPLAEDILQDAYLTILEGRAHWSQTSQYRTWLFGVIKMTARANIRKQTRHNLSFSSSPIFIDQIEAPPCIDPLTKSVAAAMAALPARQSQIADLIFTHDLTIEDAAKVMNISVGSARTHYARAKKKLKQILRHAGNTGASHDE